MEGRESEILEFQRKKVTQTISKCCRQISKCNPLLSRKWLLEMLSMATEALDDERHCPVVTRISHIHYLVLNHCKMQNMV